MIGKVKHGVEKLRTRGTQRQLNAMDLGLVESVPYLIQRLKSDKQEFRADAAEALSKLTRLGLEYQSLDSEDQRRSAIKTYQRWWEEYKKDRRGPDR